MRGPLIRLGVLLVGGFVTFQSTSNALKVAYAVLAAALFFVSLAKLSRHDERVIRFRPFAIASLALLVLLLATYVQALANGASGTDWLRDATPYMLALTLPIIGIEAGAKLTRHQAVRLLLIAGIVSTLAFASQWLGNRGISGFGHIGFGSVHLSAALFAYATARAATDSGNRRRWILLAAVTLALLLSTGNRTALLLLVAVVGMLGSRRKCRIPVSRAVGVFAGVAILFSAFMEFIVTVIPGEGELLGERIGLLVQYLQGGADQSAMGRSIDGGLALDAFRSHPWFGTGPGHLYADPYFIPGVTNQSTYVHGYAFTLDSPWLQLAKFGIIGTALLLGWLALLARGAVRTRQAFGPSAERTAFWGWAFAALALDSLAVGIESKGFALTLMVLLAVFVARPDPSSEPAERKAVERATGELVPL